VISFSITTIIVAITVVVSFLAFNDKDLSYKLTLSPYSVKHHKRWWQVFTHGFIHADYMHLGLNMYVLYSFGGFVEDVLVEGYYSPSNGVFIGGFGNIGYLYYITLYVGGLLFATLPSLKKHGDNPGYLAVGASGAVSAIVFSSIILYPTGGMGILFIPISIPSFIFGALYLLAEHYMSKKGVTRIAHDAHIGGAFFGIIFTVLLDFQFLINFIDMINDWFSTIF
jgi:membrane associated rhomboid family serine protease